MELVKVDIGLLFWMTLSFGVVLYVLAKFAWKPIMKGIHEREESIAKALNAAEDAKKAMLKLKAGNEELLLQAKEERDALMREARKLKDAIIEEARVKAGEEAQRIIENARENIQYEKLAVINDLKNQVAAISIEIAEKILQKELSNREEQHQLTQKLLDEVKIN
ncbi:MAG TPA: F0F1 ATP synthase subunit B [Bacteroidales bacterium]|nr:F0F1 ATP synthase subunit B [Bacteroidales bacterium]HPT03224.1 F0F1 ATP synthase subunit B [Bacteroidales bacterium]